MGALVYALLVRALLPRRLHRRLGADLVHCHREVMRSARGPMDRAGVWLREIGDLLVAAWRVRARGSTGAPWRSASPAPGPRPRAGAAAPASIGAALVDDVRHAIRSLVRSPGSTAFVVLVMGGGLGAATAVYSAVRHTLLHPLPYDGADRMVSLWRTVGEGGSMITPTPEQIDLWSAQPDLVEGSLRIGSAAKTLTGRGDPAALSGSLISQDYFSALGVRPTLGRSFTAEEFVDDGPRSVMLSHATWTRRFGGDPDVLGTSVTLDGEPWTVIGVGPARAPRPDGLPIDPDFYLPMTAAARGTNAVVVLREGVTLEAYRERIDTLVARAAAEADAPARFGGTATSASRMTGGRIRRSLTLVAVAVGFLLLIACLNVSALLVNRADRRRHEIAVRMALGVGRARLVRQHGIESVVLAGLAVLAGMMVALLGVEAVVRFRPDDLSVLDRVHIDAPVAGFTALVGMATGLVFGLLPALQAGSGRGIAALRGGTRTGREDRTTQRARWGLVVGEVALSFALLVASALLVRTMISIQAMDVGFDPEGVVTVEVDLPEWRYPEPADRAALLERLVSGVGRATAVAGVGTATGLPTRPGVYFGTLEIEGRTVDERVASRPFFGFSVGSDYFSTLGQPILAGRGFTPAEVLDEAPLYVLGASTAESLWPGEDPVGRRMRIGEGPWYTVVGVTTDVPMTSMTPDDVADRQIYQPSAPSDASWLVVRARGDRTATMRTIRDVVRAEAPDMPLSMDELSVILGRSVSVQRFTMRLLVVLGILAVGLAGLGLYGVVAQTVGRRTREIGIRMSLGARPVAIVWMVVRTGGLAIAVGIATGAVLARAGGRIIESQLVVVEAGDPVSFLAAAAVLVVAAGLATVLPARRAARVDPVRAITAE